MVGILFLVLLFFGGFVCLLLRHRSFCVALAGSRSHSENQLAQFASAYQGLRLKVFVTIPSLHRLFTIRYFKYI